MHLIVFILVTSEHCFPLTALWIMQTKELVETEQDFSVWSINHLGSNKWTYNLGILEICSYPFMSLRKSSRSHWKMRNLSIPVVLHVLHDICFNRIFLPVLSLLFTFYLLILIFLQKLERLKMSNLDLL